MVIDLAGVKALHRRQVDTCLALLEPNHTLFLGSSNALWSLASAKVLGRKEAAR
jgi:hypothetical protein